MIHLILIVGASFLIAEIISAISTSRVPQLSKLALAICLAVAITSLSLNHDYAAIIEDQEATIQDQEATIQEKEATIQDNNTITEADHALIRDLRTKEYLLDQMTPIFHAYRHDLAV